MNKLVFYDVENDILSIHKGFSSDEKFKGNIDAGEVILDVSTKGRIRGIEIIRASDFLKNFGITEVQLRKLTDADMSATTRPVGITVSISLKIKDIEIPAKIAVPLTI